METNFGRNEVNMTNKNPVLGQRLGDDEFPIEWQTGENQLFWVLNDLHVPNPVSPMYFSIGGYWLNADYLFRRFGMSTSSDWIAKSVNGYLYTSIVPNDPAVRVERELFGGRYAAHTPFSQTHADRLAGYTDWLLPSYGRSFTAAWNDRIKPDMERSLAYFDGLDLEVMTMQELAVVLEDVIDMHDRHWKYHWQLNFGQLSATLNLETTIRNVAGDTDPEILGQLLGRLQNSAQDRNWDSMRDLATICDEIRKSETLSAAFDHDAASAIEAALASTEEGRAFLAGSIADFADEYGHKAIWTHELLYPTWREDLRPIFSLAKNYLTGDFDCDTAQAAVRDDLDAAIEEALALAPDSAGRARIQEALDLAIPMNPMTPDHHFYIDQGTNARVRVALIAIGQLLFEAGLLAEPNDVMYLDYSELRAVMVDPANLDSLELTGDRRDAHEEYAKVLPPDWIGTATEEFINEPYTRLWGFPDRFYATPSTEGSRIKGVAASPGEVTGVARVVTSPEEFTQIKEGEILVARMTNPAWQVVFPKIAGLVTDAGGSISHPAVLAREFELPAVTGTTVATTRLATGDRIRVDGTAGIVEILDWSEPNPHN